MKNIIIKPILTEKMAEQGEKLNRYAFEVDKKANKIEIKNAIEKFGPVRTVKPELVFEIAFEGIAFSKRHKSGVALRFPRMKRWRKDKTVKNIDTIESVKALITAQ